MHSFNYRRSEHSNLASELQLLEDLKFLVLHQKDVFREFLNEKPDRMACDPHKSTSSSLRKLGSIKNSKIDSDPEIFAQISATALQAIKLSLIAHNCPDLTSFNDFDPMQLNLTP